MSNPCKCDVCTLSRRKREIDKAPTIEAYKAYCDDLMEFWMNDNTDLTMEIINLKAKYEPEKGSHGKA